MKKWLLIIIALLFISCLILISNFQGRAIQGSSIISNQIFNNGLNFEIKSEFLDSCFPKSEIMLVIEGAKCCPGLTEIPIIDESEYGSCLSVTGVALCTDCGNSLCEFGENKCNCASDCRV